MPRFAILEHDWPTRHWDFLLEAGSRLRSWRLFHEPGPHQDVPAEASADHRLLYLDYAGPVSGGRGTVSRWDVGTFEWIDDEPDHIAIELRGARLGGRCVISRDRWQLTTPAITAVAE